MATSTGRVNDKNGHAAVNALYTYRRLVAPAWNGKRRRLACRLAADYTLAFAASAASRRRGIISWADA